MLASGGNTSPKTRPSGNADFNIGDPALYLSTDTSLLSEHIDSNRPGVQIYISRAGSLLRTLFATDLLTFSSSHFCTGYPVTIHVGKSEAYSPE